MRIEFYQREDERWAWRLIGANGFDIIANDGGQGYENKGDAMAAAASATNYLSRQIQVIVL
jgi:hypothetical protein